MPATKVSLKRTGNFKFEAKNSAGKIAVIDGPESIGGTEDGVRPMEMVLMGLAGCSSFDVLTILKKQKQEVEDLDITVKGYRADSIPSVFVRIEVNFEASGNVDETKLEKACALSMEKYCSVANMLNKTADISFRCSVKD